MVDGDLRFFGSDGLPLTAHFSQEPRMNGERNTYFPGVYILEPATGENLRRVISDAVPEQAFSYLRIIALVVATDEAATEYGWSDTVAMRMGTERILQVLLPEMVERVTFATSRF